MFVFFCLFSMLDKYTQWTLQQTTQLREFFFTASATTETIGNRFAVVEFGKSATNSRSVAFLDGHRQIQLQFYIYLHHLRPIYSNNLI